MPSKSPTAERIWLGRLALARLWRLRKGAYRNAGAKPGENAWSLLGELNRTRKAVDIEGRLCDTVAFITAEEGRELHRLVTETKPRLALEVGFLHGYSTLHLLQGLADNGTGRLVSIDPGQFGEYARGVGLMNVRRAGLDRYHAFMDAPSQFALPDLCQKAIACDLAFIDGNHLLDFTVLEFFYIDKMLRVGGVMAFHDYQNPSVFAAVNYIEANFPYDVSPCSTRNLRNLVKRENDSRPWYYFVPFRVAQVAWTTLENRPFVEPESSATP